MNACKLDDATVIPRPACAIEDAAQMIDMAGAPMAAACLLTRLAVRWGRQAAASAVQALLASGRIEWVEVAGRSDCVQMPSNPPAPVKARRVLSVIPRKAPPKPSKTPGVKRDRNGVTRARLAKLLHQPISLSECSTILGIGYGRAKKHMEALMSEGLAEVVGEMRREGRGRGGRVYANPTIARGAVQPGAMA